MDKFIVEGPTPLEGEVVVSGAKNAVLPLMAAALLARGTSVIRNVPNLRDVGTMIKMLDVLGARTAVDGDVLTIDTTNAEGVEAPYDLVRTMRASIYVLAPTLAVHGRARVSLPGGCAWGPRPIDLHLMAMEKLGAQRGARPRLHRSVVRPPARRGDRVSDFQRGCHRADRHGRGPRGGNVGDRERRARTRDHRPRARAPGERGRDRGRRHSAA